MSQAMAHDHVTQIDIVDESNLHNPATLSRTKREEKNGIRALYRAAIDGNWQVAEVLIRGNPRLLHSWLTIRHDTALHIATNANRIAFIRNLVNILSRDDLTLQIIYGDTAFHIAATSGFVNIAQILYEKNKELPNLNNKNEEIPLFKAVRSGHKEMTRYLFPLTDIDKIDVQDRIRLFVAMIMSEMYDIAIEMLKKHTNLAYGRDDKGLKLTALHVLAEKPLEIASGSGARTMIKYIRSWICGEAFMSTLAYELLDKIWKQALLDLEDEEFLELISATPRVLFEAIKSGNLEFLTLLFRSFPHLIWESDEDDKPLFHAPVLHRQEKIFNIIYNLGTLKDYATMLLDKEGNNILHMAGKLPPAKRLGTSRPNLQMQRELLWFKEVKRIMPPLFINLKNKKGFTPTGLFFKEHKELLVKGQNAMKETANSCMVVSTLISTIVFAAALVVPGSITSSAPQTLIFNKDTWFMIFVVSNAVALFSSSTSIILLLSILTSSFVESEYITSLQAKMMSRLIALFISIASMVIAFTAATFLIFDYKSTQVPYFIASLASLPVILFLSLHFNLGADLIRSAYWSKFLFRPSKHKLF